MTDPQVHISVETEALQLLKEAHDSGSEIQRALDDHGHCRLCGDWKDHRPHCWLYRVREFLQPLGLDDLNPLPPTDRATDAT